MDKAITKDSNLVKILVASAKHESQDTALLDEANSYIRELASDLSPDNKYRIAQIVGFTVNEMVKPATNWLAAIADLKTVAYGEKAQFNARLDGIKAVIHAKGSTTERSKVASKGIVIDTKEISARPVINIVELRAGQANMADLIAEATYQMELAEYKLVQDVLNAAVVSWSSPYYGSGSNIVPATLDPMIRHWMRMSAGGTPVLLGDIEVISKLAAQTGFVASTNTQWADAVINEQNMNGFIGTYGGARVANMINPVQNDDAPVFDTKKLFILPAGVDAASRPLKIVHEGDVEAQEQTNIDDKSYEVRLDRWVGAGIVYGNRPYMSVYKDLSN